jgi:hypothetical protein
MGKSLNQLLIIIGLIGTLVSCDVLKQHSSLLNQSIGIVSADNACNKISFLYESENENAFASFLMMNEGEEEIRGVLVQEIAESFGEGAHVDIDYYLKTDAAELVKLRKDLLDQATKKKVGDELIIGGGFRDTIKNTDKGAASFGQGSGGEATPRINSTREFVVSNVRPVEKRVTQGQGGLRREMSLLLVMVEFNDVETFDYISLGQAQDFSNEIVQYFSGISFGKMQINNDLDQDNNADVAKVKLDQNITCGTAAFHANVLNEIQNYNQQDYTNILFVTKDLTHIGHCDYHGVAHNPGRLVHITRLNLRTAIHEISHNMGMGHAAFDLDRDGSIDFSADSEDVIGEAYGDGSCNMGNIGSEPRHVNPPHALKMGLFDDYPLLVKNVVETGTYSLNALAVESMEQTKILTLGAGLAEYGISIGYRKATGLDSVLPYRFKNQVIIYDNKVRGVDSDFGASDSMVLDKLKNKGEEYIHPTTGTKIKLVSKDDQASIEIVIPEGLGEGSSNGEFCVRSNPGLEVHSLKHMESGRSILNITVANNDMNCPDSLYKVNMVGSGLGSLWASDNNFTLSSGETKNLDLNLENLPMLMAQTTEKDSSQINGSISLISDQKIVDIPFQFIQTNTCE